MIHHGDNIRKSDIHDFQKVLNNDSNFYGLLYIKHDPYCNKNPFGRKRWVKDIIRCDARNFFDDSKSFYKGKTLNIDTSYFDL